MLSVRCTEAALSRSTDLFQPPYYLMFLFRMLKGAVIAVT